MSNLFSSDLIRHLFNYRLKNVENVIWMKIFQYHFHFVAFFSTHKRKEKFQFSNSKWMFFEQQMMRKPTNFEGKNLKIYIISDGGKIAYSSRSSNKFFTALSFVVFFSPEQATPQKGCLYLSKLNSVWKVILMNRFREYECFMLFEKHLRPIFFIRIAIILDFHITELILKETFH